MKTKILMFVAFALIIPIPMIYAPPSVNPDWQDYPYCPGGCPHEFLVDGWAEYYDVKGKEWMERKRIELFSAYNNGMLDDWIDSDPTKANQNVFTYYYIQGQIPNSDGEYFVVIPSCDGVVLTEDEEICSTDDSPPCPEPSFRKNGMCVIEKKSLCGDGTIMKNNQCVAELSYDFIDEQMNDDLCPVIHFVGYAWEDCGSIWTWSILGVPLLMIIVAPIGIVLAVIIWRIRK